MQHDRVELVRTFDVDCRHYIQPAQRWIAESAALVREAARRSIRLAPFDVQWIAGMAMPCGCIAELPTGEGKTLAAVFTACLRALSGRGVHVLTFNDYLARRDAAWMGHIYRTLIYGLPASGADSFGAGGTKVTR